MKNDKHQRQTSKTHRLRQGMAKQTTNTRTTNSNDKQDKQQHMIQMTNQRPRMKDDKTNGNTFSTIKLTHIKPEQQQQVTTHTHKTTNK